MKITFINRMAGVAPGGGEIFDLSAARELARAGCQVTLLAGRRLGRRGPAMSGVSVRYLPTPYLRGLMYWGEARGGFLGRVLGALGKRADLLLFESAALLAIAFSPLRHSDVFQVCGLPRLASWLCRCLHKAAVVRWPGPPGKRSSRWKYSADIANGAALEAARRQLPATSAVPTGIDGEMFHPGNTSQRELWRRDPRELIVLYAGRLVPIKNLDLLLEGCGAAQSAGVRLRLVLVGEGPERARLEARARALGVAAVFAGAQPHAALPGCYLAADVFALTSTYDNFPNAVLEAMACELPVVATRVGGLPALVEDGVTGWLVEDSRQLAAALCRLAADAGLRRRMGAAGRARAVGEYSWAATAAALLGVYHRCLPAAPRSSAAEDPERLAKRMQRVFGSNQLYFSMMSEHHRRAGGAAIEPEVRQAIFRHCRRGGRVLEAGCGEGSIANWLAAQFPGTRFVGVDISPLGIARARAAAAANACFGVGDITALSFAGGTFDFIYSQSVIEHVPGWQKFLGEARRVLAPGGRLLVRVGNGGVQDTRRRRALMRYLLRRNRVRSCDPSFRLQAGNDEEHSSNFDAQHIPSDVLLAEMKRAGLKVVGFTTLTERWAESPRLLLRLAARVRVWPISHLGPVTIALAEKSQS